MKHSLRFIVILLLLLSCTIVQAADRTMIDNSEWWNKIDIKDSLKLNEACKKVLFGDVFYKKKLVGDLSDFLNGKVKNFDQKYYNIVLFDIVMYFDSEKLAKFSDLDYKYLIKYIHFIIPYLPKNDYRTAITYCGIGHFYEKLKDYKRAIIAYKALIKAFKEWDIATSDKPCQYICMDAQAEERIKELEKLISEQK